MGKETGISWTNHTHNLWWGCTKVSEGCKNCYAETFAGRYGWDVWGPGKERREFDDKHNAEPLKWNRAAMGRGIKETVFCGSMMDWCDVEAPAAGVRHMWEIINATNSNLIWLLLTKRPERIPELLPKPWNPRKWFNVVFGTSIELDKYVNRADRLRDISGVKRFISAEPLLGPLPSLNLKGIDWLIVGGESGSGWRKMEKEWAVDLRNRCEKNKRTTFFYKQSNGQFSGNEPWLEEDGVKKTYHNWPKRFGLPLVAKRELVEDSAPVSHNVLTE